MFKGKIQTIVLAIALLTPCRMLFAAEEPPALSKSDKEFLVRSAREIIRATLEKKDVVPVPKTATEESGEPGRTAFVTLFCDGRLVDARHATEVSYSKAVAVAATRVGAALRLKPNAKTLLEASRIKIDLLGDLVPVQVMAYRSVVDLFNLGVEGAAVVVGGGIAYLLPTTLLFNRATADSMIRNIISLGKRASPEGKAPLMKFKTAAFIEEIPGGAVLDLYRGNVLLEKVDSAMMEQSFKAGGYWMLGVQQKNGRFKYRFDPVERTQDIAYSAVRQAAACWGLLWLYQRTGDEKFLYGAKKGIEFLKLHLRRDNKRGECYVESTKRPSLAATSVYLLCLTDLALVGEESFDEKTLKALGNFIVRLQKDDGNFYAFADEIGAERQTRTPLRSVGQATLALIHAYKLLGAEEAWLRATMKAADYAIEQINTAGEVDNWTSLALAELYALTGERKYADACIRMADNILPHQVSPGEVPDLDFIGGFDDAVPPLTLSAAIRIQCLATAWDLAPSLKVDRKKYADVILLAARFIMQQQFRSDNAYMADPTFTWAGGFHRSPTNFELRLDYTQNSIAALICACDVAREMETKGGKE